MTYGYRCPTDCPVEIRKPIGTAPATIACPHCGSTAARMITAPMLGLADPARMAVLDHTKASRDEPAVVSSVPTGPRRRPSVPLDPRTRTLPRP